MRIARTLAALAALAALVALPLPALADDACGVRANDVGCGTPILPDAGTSGPVGAYNDAPFAEFRTHPEAQAPNSSALAINPGLDGMIKGRSPLTVIYNMCPSSDPDGDPLKYSYDFDGDGNVDFAGTCRGSNTYKAEDLPDSQCQTPDKPAQVCVSDRQPDSSHKICRQYQVCAKDDSEAAPALPCVPLAPGPYSGNLSTASSTQLGRIFRDGVPSTCAGKAYPGNFNAGTSYGYQVFSFRNQGTNPACVRVTMDVDSAAVPAPACGTNAHGHLYLTPYNPASQGTGYLGDVGSSISQPFEATIPGSTDFQVVVTNTSSIPAAPGCNFMFTLTNVTCP